jgi:CheY-like chemotaxis protein
VLHNVLVADDADVREMVILALARHGLSAILAAEGDEALALVRRCRPDPIRPDVVMPSPDGIAACRTLRADPATAATPVVVLTAEARRAARAPRPPAQTPTSPGSSARPGPPRWCGGSCRPERGGRPLPRKRRTVRSRDRTVLG